MNMKPQFLPLSHFRRQSRHIWLLALGLALAPSLVNPVWAENYNLDSVDFSNTEGGMRVVLHTGSIVPVQKVLISENKLILDIDQINAVDTVRTNFSGADNVSHVIMQPLNEHKIRLIVRGENLSAPTVAFYASGSNDGGGLTAEQASRLSMSTNAALRSQQEAGLQPAVNTDTGRTQGETAAVDVTQPKTDESVPFGGFVDNKGTTHSGGEIKPSETGPLALRTPEPANVGGNDFLAQFSADKFAKYIPYGLLAMVLLGAGAFVRHKLTQLNPAETGFEDLLEEQQAGGRRSSFREMANAYRSKHEDKRLDTSARRSKADDMIGLRGLNQPVEDDLDAILPATPADDFDESPAANSLEKILAAMQAANQPKKPILGASTPKKQAVNQYAQTQTKPKQKSRQAADEAMLQEMKRAQAAQQELQQQLRQQAAQQAAAGNAGQMPVNRAAAAKKAVKSPNFQTVPSGNAINSKPTAGKTQNRPANAAPKANPAQNQRAYTPVPGKPAAAPGKPQAKQGALSTGNPEVLNFLRNVAELMEKDGKGEIARSIHKNLGNKNVGGLTQ